MKKQAGIWIDSTKAIIVTLDAGKEYITEIQSELENRVYHDKEGDKGSFFFVINIWILKKHLMKEENTKPMLI